VSEARRPRWPALVLAGLVLVVAVLLWTQARRVGYWSNDEDYFVQLARLLAEHFPSAVWDMPVQPFDERGIQRLTVLLLAVPLSVINGVEGFELARVLMCLAWASAAVPAYLLGRGVGLAPWWALAGAALTIVAPWATLTATFLSESAAYPMWLWAIYGAWRACVVPGVRSDLLALALAFGAGFARTNLLVVAAVAPVAVVLTTVLATRREGRSGWARRAATRVARQHPLLTLVLVVGGALGLLTVTGLQPSVLQGLTGSYVTSVHIIWDVFLAKLAFQLGGITVGLALLPVIVGFGWILWHAVRPAGVREHALALTCLLAGLILLFSTMYAAGEERYVMYLAPLFLLPALVALARRDVPPAPLVVSGLLVALLIGLQDWKADFDPTRLVSYPGESVFTRVWLNRIDQVWPAEPLIVVVLAIVLLTAGAALVASGRAGPRRAALAGTGALAALLVVQALQTQYVVRDYATKSTGPVSLAERTWVDETVPAGETVLMSAAEISNSRAYVPVWREVVFWNRRAELQVTQVARDEIQMPRYGGAVERALDEPSGRVLAPETAPVPRYALMPTLYRAVGFASTPIRRSKYLPLELVRLNGTPRATYQWSGAERDGWLTDKQQTAESVIYPAAFEAAKRPCLLFSLVAPGEARGHRYVVTARGFRRTGEVPGGEVVSVQVPITRSTGRVRVRASGSSPSADGRRLSLQIADTGVGACSGS
jgi:hypothetical protein